MANVTIAASNCEDSVAGVDMARMRRYRLDRVKAELRRLDYGGCVLFDPINIRYATDTRNMSLWCMHSPNRYIFVAAGGPTVLFDGHAHKKEVPVYSETVDEVRPATTWYYEVHGPRAPARARQWAGEIDDLMRMHAGKNRRLAIDRLGPLGIEPLFDLGITIKDAQEPLEQARAIKSADEIALMRVSIGTCESAMARMRAALKPGMSENELFAILHETNIREDGEWIETRLLASGQRTNPWYQKAGKKIIMAGELVAFDTDLIGPYGYCADLSRTFYCKPGKPTAEQRRLYAFALENIRHNIELLRPGVSFREFSSKTWPIPEEFSPNRYGPAHGVGLADEYPDLYDSIDWDHGGYDGVFEKNMTICVESYIGAVGGSQGVKLEEQVLITESGPELLSRFPYEEELIA